MAVMATPVIMDEAISRVRMVEFFKLWSSKQPCRAAFSGGRRVPEREWSRVKIPPGWRQLRSGE